MFELFRRAALRLAKDYDNSYIHDGEKNKEIEWEQAHRISLISNSRLSSLPEMPTSCRILTLLFQKSSLGKFPISFFVYMRGLQLLDLHKTMIRVLPTSISSLINLTALFLNDCNQLMEVPVEVGDLCRLEILDIRHTGIPFLPTEIGRLTNLKCLKVSFIENVGNHNHVEARQREMISSNIIARLDSLEELSIDVNPTDRSWKENARIIVKEVAALEELTTLCFYFPTEDCLQTFINESRSWNGNDAIEAGNNFRSFHILVGYHQRSIHRNELDFSEYLTKKHLRFSGGEGFSDAVLNILEQTCSFELIGHRHAANLSFGANYLEGLEACTIEHCQEMTSIIDGDHTRGAAFQCLNKLHINNLPNLVHIWNGKIESSSLCMLTTLTLEGCHSLRSLFSQQLVLQLNQLNYLQVEDCNIIEEIIEADSVVGSGAFPKLKNLKLIHLPRLSSICTDVSLTWDALKTIKIDSCENLRNFSSSFENALNLMAVHYTEHLWNQSVWSSDAARERFQNLYQPL